MDVYWRFCILLRNSQYKDKYLDSMEITNLTIDPWVRKHLIPRLTKNESNVEFTVDRPNGNYYLSDPFFVTFRSPQSGEKKILVKLPSQDPEVNYIDYDTLFANEIAFYKEIARGDSDYPQCYFAGKDPVFKTLIVLEDVRPRGYAVSPSKVDVNSDYIVAGVKAIAKFHALTFEFKEKEPEKFYKFVQSMHDSRFKENSPNERFRSNINESCRRPIEKIRARKDKSELTKKMCDLFSDDTFANVMAKCVNTDETLATVIHGDCTINNMLFRWKKNGGDTVLEAMLIDFGLLMYSSPVLDVATLFYMTCTREDIRDHAKDFFEIYHSTLTECLKERGIWNADKYSLDVFWRDYRRLGAVFGFIIAAFFRGMMTDFDREHNVVQVESMTYWHVKDGGEQVLNLLVDMLDDLRDAGMLERFIGK